MQCVVKMSEYRGTTQLTTGIVIIPETNLEDTCMNNKSNLKPIAAAIGTTFAVSLAFSPVANANENPFSLNELSGGFMVAGETGKCGTLCGGAEPKMDSEGKMIKCGNVCGEVEKCGTLCGGVVDRPQGKEADKDAEVAKCGNICAAAK